MLVRLVRVFSAMAMTVLIFIGVIVAAAVGVLLWSFWTALQFVALGLVAVVGVAFTVTEAFRYRKSKQAKKSADSKSAADQSPT